MAISSCIAALKFQASGIFGTNLGSSNIRPSHSANMIVKPLVIEARAPMRTESAKIRNRRLRKKVNKRSGFSGKSYSVSRHNLAALDELHDKCYCTCSLTRLVVHHSSCTVTSIWQFNGTATRPRLSVFCSDKQLYAMLVDDQNKKCLFYGSTLQKAMRKDPSCTTAEAAKLVGEELIKTCVDLNINEISSYDRNGLARGERMQAFEIAIGHHGFLPR